MLLNNQIIVLPYGMIIHYLNWWMVLLLGFFSQGLFGLRLLIQLWHTEKYKTTEAPLLYWYTSLWAALLYLLYGVIRQDAVIILGQVITYFIYIRNIQLQKRWYNAPKLLRLFYLFTPIVMLLVFAFSRTNLSVVSLSSTMFWIGFLGQLMMNMRFVVQWIYAERMSTAAFPIIFWYVSIIGSILLIIYGCWHPLHGFDPVIILSQLLAMLVYVRSVYHQQRMSPMKVVEK
jgi:lipid-A-disaccharide synthase-like uncharacterized protein